MNALFRQRYSTFATFAYLNNALQREISLQSLYSGVYNSIYTYGLYFIGGI